jgi:hypothetical protein
MYILEVFLLLGVIIAWVLIIISIIYFIRSISGVEEPIVGWISTAVIILSLVYIVWTNNYQIKMEFKDRNI